MRKQYHSRDSSRGNLVWDVDRLVKLSKALPRKRVSLASLHEFNEPYWFGGVEIPTCRSVADHARLIEATDLKYPIILSADGRIMDGMHRVAKAYLQGLESIEVVQFVTDPEPDYIDVDVDSLSYDETLDE